MIINRKTPNNSKEKSIIIMNPPYGERISSNNLLELYTMIGERLKHAFTGNDAWILSYRDECFDQIGLKASTKIPLFNGALECQFRKYQIFSGKYKIYRANSQKEFKTKPINSISRSSRYKNKPSTEKDKLSKIPANLRYIHRRRSTEENI